MDDLMVKSAIEAILSKMIDESKSVIKYSKDEISQFVGSGIEEYLTRQMARFSVTKTILTGATRVNFYHTYFPLKMRNFGYSDEEKRRRPANIKLDSAALLYLDSKNHLNKIRAKRLRSKIAVIGDAGSGKSTVSKHLFMQCIKEKFKIPIFIELRNFKIDSGSLTEYVKGILIHNDVAKNNEIFNRLIERGDFLFFLDGYDEIAGEKKYETLSEIDDFSNRYGQNYYFITSRPYCNVESLPEYTVYELAELNRFQISEFIEKQLIDEDEAARAIIDKIDSEDLTIVESFLKNPLLLSLFILTFKRNPSIPSQRNIFYRRVVNALFTEHDSITKSGFQRNWQCKLTQDQFEDVLKAFSVVTFMGGNYSFRYDDLTDGLVKIIDRKPNINCSVSDFIKDMKMSISLWVEDGGLFSFSHRSIQEYFGSLFIKEQSFEKKGLLYEKLRQRLESGSISEVNSFLSLCEEIDEIDFNEHFLIPMLDKFISSIDEIELASSIVGLFFNALSISHEGGKSAVQTSESGLRHDLVLSNETILYRYFIDNFDASVSRLIRAYPGADLFRKAGIEREYYLGGNRTFSFGEYPRLKSAVADVLLKDSENFVHFYSGIKELRKKKLDVIRVRKESAQALLELI